MSLDTRNACMYLPVLYYYGGSNYTWGSLRAYKGSYANTNLVNTTNCTIDSDPTSGNSRFKNLGATAIQGY